MTPPVRTCIGCRRVDEQSALRRFVLREGVVLADPRRREPGRGAWLHDDEQCRQQALRRGAFARAFRTRVRVPDELFDLADRTGVDRGA